MGYQEPERLYAYLCYLINLAIKFPESAVKRIDLKFPIFGRQKAFCLLAAWIRFKKGQTGRAKAEIHRLFRC